MAGTLRIGLLGSLTVETPGGDHAVLASPVQRRLLSILALQGGQVLSADRLGDILECSPGSLRTVVSRLRGRVGADHVVTSPPGYALVAATDAAEFEDLLAAAGTATGAAALGLLDRAVALWRGEAVEEFRDEPWAVPAVARLDELRAAAIELRAETMVTEGMAERAIADMTAHIVRHPLREHPRGLLMRALAADGRPTEALRAYQDFRQLLVEEIGTEPSEEIRSIERSIAAGAAGEVGDEPFVPMERRAFLFAEVDPHTSELDSATIEQVLAEAVAANHGIAVLTASGARAAAFDAAADAVAAAHDAHVALGGAAWSAASAPEVAIGVHHGTAVRRDDRWYGPTLDEVQRIAAVGAGGQIVVSEVVASMLARPVTDLGEHRLRDIHGARRLFQVDVAGRTNEFPPLRSIGSYQTTLPAQRTSLIGRDDLVARVRALLADHRLVTLLGPGGVGKTRVAIEVAGQALGRFPGGVFFTDLTRASAASDVEAEVLRSMKLTPRAGQGEAEAVTEFLHDRAALLVVDNCEHVVDRAAEVIDDLLLAAPDTRVVATSREPLELHGERRLIVPSLDVDGPTSAGVRLFTDRVTALDETAVAGDADLRSVEEIARRLDGIPLAIELAAAQASTLAPSTILELLDDRFALLTSNLRRVPRRQQTLQATIDWSYHLLDPQEQRAFRLLSTCAGACSPATAARVLGTSEIDAARLLESLRAKSLLVEVSAGGERLGYNFLETLREYGRERSAEAGGAADAHRSLEVALLPSSDALADWTVFVNEYLCAPDPAMMIEDTTRLAAADRALRDGRADAAAFLFGSVAFRDDVGALQARADVVRPLTARPTELSPMAWVAANATELLLARGARDYGRCFEIALTVLGELGPDDRARSWFESWRCALTIAVAPEAGLADLEACLPVAVANAHPPLDWTVSQMLAMKATGLAFLGRLGEADPLAEEAARWAPIGQESRDQILALRLWFGYLDGARVLDDVLQDVADQPHELGLAELCAAPAALSARGTFDERAGRLVAAARRRPKLDIPTPYLLAFAWLAIEEGDHDRARPLLAVAELYDASTQLALLYALAAIDGWTPATWDQERDAAVVRYLSAEQEVAARAGTDILAEEVDRWERWLEARVTGPRPVR